MARLKAKTVSIRVPEVKLKRLRNAAVKAGQTFSAYAVESMELRITSDARELKSGGADTHE